MPKKKRKSTVNKAGNYTKPTMRKRLFEKIKRGGKGGKPGQWSARKAQMLAKEYKSNFVETSNFSIDPVCCNCGESQSNINSW